MPVEYLSNIPTIAYTVRNVPSMRMMVDLSNLQNSLSIHRTGQSGHPGSPRYSDMTDLWRMIEYHTMMWNREAHLVLVRLYNR